MTDTQIKTLVEVHNSLLRLHPTGEDILTVGFSVAKLRSLLQEIQSKDGGDTNDNSV